MLNRLLSAACVLSLSSPAFAATVVARSDSDLIRLSDRIVRARAIESRSERGADGRTIYTVTTMAVLEDFTGGTETRIEVRELGGIIGNEFLYVAGAVQYAVGEEVVLCLERGPRGLRALGMNLGRFAVDRTPAGEVTLRRNLEHTVVAGGGTARAAAKRTLDDFRRLARAIRGASAREFEQHAPAAAEGPVTAPFTLLTIGGLPVRWIQADSGIPVHWYKNTTAPDPLISGDAVSEIQTALAAWTNPPSASIVLQYGGPTTQSNPMDFTGLPGPSGVISFEDPNNEISGGTLAIGGGFGFVGTGGTKNGQQFSGFDRAFVIFQNAVDLADTFRQSRDFTRVLQHEIGHGIGFGHTQTDNSVPNAATNIMYPFCCSAETPLPPSLGPDDLAALNFVYPAQGPACTYTISPSSASVSSAAAGGSVSVSTQAGCGWTAQPNASFLTVTGGASGAGPGTVTYAVAVNTAPVERTGALTIAGRTFTVTQAARRPTALDLNFDGRLDLLWQHQGDGQISAWLMNGLNLIDGTLLTPSQVADTDWKLQGAGDLDGDGHMDLVWQNIADGRVSAWLMNGLVQRQGTLFSIPEVPDTRWRIRSVGDLNGDRKADLFWQHEGDGSIAVWLMNGLTVIDGTLLSPSQVADLDWKIVGTADFDRNGTRDLVWHHQGDGRIAVWFMNGTAQISGASTNPGQVADVNWKIRGVGDLNGDGRPDLLWQNVADGRLSAWLMNGLNLIEGTLLNPSQVPDTNWHIVGPR